MLWVLAPLFVLSMGAVIAVYSRSPQAPDGWLRAQLPAYLVFLLAATALPTHRWVTQPGRDKAAAQQAAEAKAMLREAAAVYDQLNWDVILLLPTYDRIDNRELPPMDALNDESAGIHLFLQRWEGRPVPPMLHELLGSALELAIGLEQHTAQEMEMLKAGDWHYAKLAPSRYTINRTGSRLFEQSKEVKAALVAGAIGSNSWKG